MDTEPKKTDVSSAQTKLAPIPTPPGTIWREFRIKVVPFIIFAITVYGVFALWRQIPLNTGIRGLGEGTMSQITAPQDGFMGNLTVGPYDKIQEGQPLATIFPYDPAARLDLLQSQLGVSRLELEPSIEQRNAVNYEQLYVDLRRLNQELAMAKANLGLAESILPRHLQLFNEKLISQDVYETTLRNKNFYQAEVQEKTKAIKEMQEQLEKLRSLADFGNTGTNAMSALLSQIKEQLASAQTNLNPVPIVSPINGRVTYLRQAGEFVRAGDPIIVVNVEKADRVVAYLKQPFPFEPQVGMQMEIITRAKNPQRFKTQISAVGGRVEMLTNSIAFLNPGSIVDMGLPVILPVPPGANIRPGELVDVMWHDEPNGDNKQARAARVQ